MHATLQLFLILVDYRICRLMQEREYKNWWHRAVSVKSVGEICRGLLGTLLQLLIVYIIIYISSQQFYDVLNSILQIYRPFPATCFWNLSRDWFLSWLTACHSATCLRDFWCTFHIPRYVIDLVRFLAVCSREENQGRSDGVYRYIYPQNQSTLKNLCGCTPVTQNRFDICSRVGH